MGGGAQGAQSILLAGGPTHLWLSPGHMCLEGKECVFPSGCQPLPLWLPPFTTLVATWEVMTPKCAKLPKTAGFLGVTRVTCCLGGWRGVILRTLRSPRPLAETLGLCFSYPCS